MSLRQMEYLVTVAEEGSFTRAAERLFVSQPALSHQIKALERSVGGELLERLPNAVQLTPMGRAFLPHATAAVLAADEARHAARAVGELEAGQLRIGTLGSIALRVLPAAIRAWRLANPEVSFELHEYLRIDELAEQMRLGAADVAVGPRPLGWDGPIRSLGQEDLGVVLAVHDPLVQAGPRRAAVRPLAPRPPARHPPHHGS